MAPDRPEASGADLARALAPLVERAAGRGRRTLVSLTMATAPRDPIELYAAARALGEAPAIWLRPPRASGCLDGAWTVRASGPDRFRSAAEAWPTRLTGIHPRRCGRVRRDGSAPRRRLPFAGDYRPDPASGLERSALVPLMLTIGLAAPG